MSPEERGELGSWEACVQRSQMLYRKVIQRTDMQVSEAHRSEFLSTSKLLLDTCSVLGTVLSTEDPGQTK